MKTKLYILAVSSILFVGCNDIPSIPKPHVSQSRSNFVTPTDSNLTQPISDVNKSVAPVVHQTVPKSPKKHIKRKEVHDNDFTPEYMYPKQQHKTPATPTKQTKTTNSNAMSEAECIELIGQDRFDRYSQMLGGTQGAIKRCKMIKASQS